MGEEVCFGTSVAVPRETNAQRVVAPGTVAFWTEGDALPLPYAVRPHADPAGRRVRLASPCNVLGRFDGDLQLLGHATVRDGDPDRVELVDT